MYRATTPTHTFTLPIDTSTCKEIQVTYKQCGATIVKHYQDGILPSGMSLDGEHVIIKLTQAETLKFAKGKNASVQVRVLTTSDDALASKEFLIVINDVLNEEILQ